MTIPITYLDGLHAHYCDECGRFVCDCTRPREVCIESEDVCTSCLCRADFEGYRHPPLPELTIDPRFPQPIFVVTDIEICM
jgi:hypothetical protein